MSVSNGATSIWSGYNHQGKVGLLVALCEINRLAAEGRANSAEDIKDALLDWSISFESSREDFDIMHKKDGTIATYSRHQVKAKISGVNESDYAKVLKPREKTQKDGSITTIPGFDCGNVDEDHRYLHVIKDINLAGWDNPYKVKLYTYPAAVGAQPKAYCDFSNVDSNDDEIIGLATVQLQQLFSDKTEDEYRVIWKDLQYQLSTRICRGHRDRTIAQFSLADIYMSCLHSEIRGYEAARLQRSVLEYWEEFVDELGNDASFTDDMCTRAEKYVQDLISLEEQDILRVMRLMHPNEGADLRNLSKEGLKQVIFKVVSEVTTEEYDRDCIKYEGLGTPLVLTTISNLDVANKGSTTTAVKKILNTIGKEDVASLFIKSKVINKSLDASFEELLQNGLRTKIVGGRKTYNILDHAPLSFVSAATAIRELNKKGV